MKVTFLGTGEACDPAHPNISVLVDDGNDLHLLDCGFTTPLLFMQQCKDGNRLQSIWISHFHGDHFFGLPQLILGLHHMGRTSPLTILSGTMPKNKVEQVLELSYPGFRAKLSYPLQYIKVPVGSQLEHAGLLWQAAPTLHAQEPFGLSIRYQNKKLYYSGDGKPTPQSKQLMLDCDLVIHEAYTLTDTLPGHYSIEECIELWTTLKLPRLALVHLAAKTRKDFKSITKLLRKTDNTIIFIPTENDSIIL